MNAPIYRIYLLVDMSKESVFYKEGLEKHGDSYRRVNKEISDQFRQTFADACVETAVGWPGPDDLKYMAIRETWAYTHDKQLIFAMNEWRRKNIDPRMFESSVSIEASNDPAAVAQARWVWCRPECDRINHDPRTHQLLSLYPQTCSVCGRVRWDKPPNPMKVSAKLAQAGKREIFDADNGVWVVSERVLRLLERYAPGEFDVGDVEVTQAPTQPTRFYWIRPRHAIGGWLDVTYVEPFCPECGQPAKEEWLNQKPNLVRHFGDPQWNIALAYPFGTEGMVRDHRPPNNDVVVSGGLFAALWNHGVKKLWWPDAGPRVSMREDEPTFEETRRFAEEFPTKKTDKILRYKPDVREWPDEFKVAGIVPASPTDPQPPSPLEGEAAREEEDVAMDENLIEAIGRHIQRHFPGPVQVLHELIPTSELHIDIHVVPATAARPFQTLITSGMSEYPMEVPADKDAPRWIELMLCLPADWPTNIASMNQEESDRYGWPIAWLKLLAQTPYQFQICFGESDMMPSGDPPEPLGAGTELCGWMVRRPRLAPEGFATLPMEDHAVHFLAVVPLYQRELDWVLQRQAPDGPDAGRELDGKLQAAGVTELLDPKRPAVV